MKPLATTKQILTWLCILPAEKYTSTCKKRAYISLVFALILADFTVFASSLLYVLKFISIDVLETSMGLYQVAASIVMANGIIVAYLFRHKIPTIFEKLSKIYEKCIYLILINSNFYEISIGFIECINWNYFG